MGSERITPVFAVVLLNSDHAMRFFSDVQSQGCEPPSCVGVLSVHTLYGSLTRRVIGVVWLLPSSLPSTYRSKSNATL
jgi:hypothetical protein